MRLLPSSPADNAVDLHSRLSQCSRVKPQKTTKPASLATGVASVGTRMVEKYRPRTSRLSDAERQKLMERGMQIIYGKPVEAASNHRR